ncbi:MAG: hypothetical protein M3373_04915 [Gemmatimonadota bacterium]|nr:hypothetical protein [Gemmatimonadota bacterium]
MPQRQASQLRELDLFELLVDEGALLDAPLPALAVRSAGAALERDEDGLEVRIGERLARLRAGAQALRGGERAVPADRLAIQPERLSDPFLWNGGQPETQDVFDVDHPNLAIWHRLPPAAMGWDSRARVSRGREVGIVLRNSVDGGERF